jgi:hypothetical protein
MAAFVIGNIPVDWSMSQDEEGHRDYQLIWQVQTDGPTYGPDYAMFASGLPVPGAHLGVGMTHDPWAFYQRKGTAKLKSRDQHRSIWLVETAFSTRPVKRCQTSSIEDPLLEPPKIRGAFDTFQREAMADKDGHPLLNAAGQRFRGPAVQIEDGWPTVEVEQNVAWINLPLLGSYRYSVNNATFWGMPTRTVKCKTFTWERVLYGTCYYYFKVVTSFQLNESKWDLHLLEEGEMVRIPGTTPPKFRRAKDDYEENVHVLLDAAGNALAPGAAEVYTDKRVLKELNFSTVGWPATLI